MGETPTPGVDNPGRRRLLQATALTTTVIAVEALAVAFGAGCVLGRKKEEGLKPLDSDERERIAYIKGLIEHDLDSTMVKDMGVIYGSAFYPLDEALDPDSDVAMDIVRRKRTQQGNSYYQSSYSFPIFLPPYMNDVYGQQSNQHFVGVFNISPVLFREIKLAEFNRQGIVLPRTINITPAQGFIQEPLSDDKIGFAAISFFPSIDSSTIVKTTSPDNVSFLAKSRQGRDQLDFQAKRKTGEISMKFQPLRAYNIR